MLALFALLVIGGLITFIFMLQGAPYVVTTDDDITDMLYLLKPLKPKRILDLGAGNGKLMIELARAGYQVDGVEINPLLVWRARRALRRAGLEGRATIKWRNFWRFDTSPYDVVLLYGVTHIMAKLEGKLQRELKPDTHVISNFFIFPNWKPIKNKGKMQLYKK
jgi:cyclopropane fatty-acyl-phospholipid synthase-like methyltransferase